MLEDLLKMRKRFWFLAIMMAVVLIIMVVFFVSIGAMKLGFVKTWQILLAGIFDAEQLAAFKANEVAIVWDIRLPRILCGIFVGMGLAVAGVIFQGLLQNPLADPYTLGVSTGAAFGASLAIILNLIFAADFSVTLMAFAFAFATLLVVIAIAGRGGGLVSSNLIIAGIIVSAILSSGISFIKMVAGEDVSAIVFWLMGSLVAKTWQDVLIVGMVVSVGSVIAFIFAADLNILALGERNAESLGVNIKKANLLFLITGAALTASCVAVSGIIGFIGLVVPHILRFWLTADHRVLVILSGLLGGILLSLADNLTRMLPNGEVPVGVLTTLIGGPFFIYVFMRKH